MANRDLLLAELSDPRYANGVNYGSNSELLDLLNAPDVGTVPAVRSVVEVIAAAGANVTPELVNTLNLMGGTVDFNIPGVLAALVAVAPKADFSQVSVRRALYAEAKGIGKVELADLWAVLPKLDGSHHQRYLACEFAPAQLKTLVYDKDGAYDRVTNERILDPTAKTLVFDKDGVAFDSVTRQEVDPEDGTRVQGGAVLAAPSVVQSKV